MDGVEILSKNNIVTFDFNWSIFFICFTIGIALGILMAKFGLFFVVLFSMTLFGIYNGCIFSEKILTDKYEYKVTISDSVSLTDFNNKYKIISQDGNIYTIKERECE